MFGSYKSTQCAFLLSVLTVVACSHRPEQPLDRALPESRDISSSLTPYPRGHWRLLHPRDLEHVVLWVSHILVRHTASDATVVGTIFDWRLDAPPSQRTRAEALARANDLA